MSRSVSAVTDDRAVFLTRRFDVPPAALTFAANVLHRRGPQFAGLLARQKKFHHFFAGMRVDREDGCPYNPDPTRAALLLATAPFAPDGGSGGAGTDGPTILERFVAVSAAVVADATAGEVSSSCGPEDRGAR